MRVMISAVFGIAVAAVAASSPCWADSLIVPVDHSMRLSMEGQASSVVVGNPKVADVAVIDTHTVFVSGRTVGLTDLTVLDALGHTIFSRDISVTRPSTGLVSVYRGAQLSELACSPSCSAYGGKGASGEGGSDAASSSGTPSVPAAPKP